MRLQKALSLLFLLALLWTDVSAHDPGLSAIEVQPTPTRLTVHLSFSRADIETIVLMDMDGDGRISPLEFSASQAGLELLARSSVELERDGQKLQANDVSVNLDESNAIHFRIGFSGMVNGHLRVRSVLLERLPYGHRQILSLQDGSGDALRQTMLDARHAVWETDLKITASPLKASAFWQFLVLGVEHILTGYDHLLFLIALLLVGNSMRDAAKIITSFTVAHSITLALATLDQVRLPSGVIEPLIALSIIYVGLENVFRQEVRYRWLVTFAFGLIHGFGFASVLREMGIGSGTAALVPLLSFNLGVEFGQILIAAVALPLIWKLRSNPHFVERYAQACSILVTVAGGYWFVERTMVR